MAPLSEALKVHRPQLSDLTRCSSPNKSSSREYESVWAGSIDAEWAVGAVPNGGYVLGLIIEACISHQGTFSPAHPDPIHVTAHFLRPTQAQVDKLQGEYAGGVKSTREPAPFEVHVKTIKSGKGFCNVIGQMMQMGLTTVSAHIIFGKLYPENFPSSEASESSRVGIVSEIKAMNPPSPYARLIPLRTHPSDTPISPMTRPWMFKSHVSWKEDEQIVKGNRRENRIIGNTSDSQTSSREPPGLEWGAWLSFTDEGEKIRPSMLAFCGDVYKNVQELLPREERLGFGKSWYPTMAMTLEFKSPLLSRLPTDLSYASRTVGLYSLSRFLQDPMGRHETYVEVWSAPSDREVGKQGGIGAREQWREGQRCLAVATQMAVSVPLEVNTRRAKM